MNYSLRKKALRIITNSHWQCHTAPLFEKLRILNIYSLNNLQVGCFMYRATHSLLPVYYNDMFTHNFNIHDHDTRHKTDLHTLHHKLNSRTYSVRTYGTTLWNSLDIDLRNASTLSNFRNKYKRLLLTQITHE